MGWFDLFRDNGHNTYYGDHRSPVLADVTHIVVILICIMFSAALVLVIIGTRGRERWTTFMRVAFTLHTGVAILVTLFGQDWQVAFIQSHCSYSTLFQDKMLAYVRVRVGLKSVNITLEGDLVSLHGKSHVDYNERFSFDQINDMEKEVITAKEKGLPQPILYVAEYFGVDSGDLIWSRAVRLAGHFVFILEWSSLAAWIVSNIVVNFVVFHGASMMILTGAMMSSACILYDSLQPSSPFTIPFEDAYIHFSYGWCFWLCAVSGAVTFITGSAILILYKLYPLKVQLIFLIDTSHLVEYHDDETDLHPLELENLGSKHKDLAHPPAYVNPGFVNDQELRMRHSIDSHDESIQRKAPLGRRVSTISISSSSGQDNSTTVLINGEPVPDPPAVASTSSELSRSNSSRSSDGGLKEEHSTAL